LIRSLYTAEKAMKFEQVRIDALANNLANANSTGFKQVLTRIAHKGAEGINNPGPDGMPADRNPGTERVLGKDNWTNEKELEMYHAVDTRPGQMVATGRDTDVAIMSRGFFVVQTDAGERYTRNGAFTVDSQQQLTTPDGNVLLGTGGPIVVNGESFSVESDGTVLVDDIPVNSLKIVDFADASKLEHEGNNLLNAIDGMNAQDLPAEDLVVAQGHIEGSNVNAIDTLIAMIQAQRAFEVKSKILTTEDEMLAKSVNKLPRVG